MGIAAIQVGYPKKVGVVRLEDNTIFTLINTEFIEGDDEFIFPRESCLSFPNTFRNVRRYQQIVITNQRIEDDKFVEEKLALSDEDGLTTIAIQHEIDHFNGKLLIDYSPDIKIEPIKRESAKVGRNDPCPCGSVNLDGSRKKYKKCCGK